MTKTEFFRFLLKTNSTWRFLKWGDVNFNLPVAQVKLFRQYWLLIPSHISHSTSNLLGDTVGSAFKMYLKFKHFNLPPVLVTQSVGQHPLLDHSRSLDMVSFLPLLPSIIYPQDSSLNAPFTTQFKSITSHRPSQIFSCPARIKAKSLPRLTKLHMIPCTPVHLTSPISIIFLFTPF